MKRAEAHVGTHSTASSLELLLTTHKKTASCGHLTKQHQGWCEPAGALQGWWVFASAVANHKTQDFPFPEVLGIAFDLGVKLEGKVFALVQTV